MDRIEPNLSGLDCRSIQLHSRGLIPRERALDDRLNRLLATIPLDVQREGLSLLTRRAGDKGFGAEMNSARGNATKRATSWTGGALDSLR